MDCLYKALPSPCHRPPRPQGLSLGTYNIHNVWGFDLNQAVLAVHLGSSNAMLLTKTKITSEAYFHNRLGYNIVFLPLVTTDAGGT